MIVLARVRGRRPRCTLILTDQGWISSSKRGKAAAAILNLVAGVTLRGPQYGFHDWTLTNQAATLTYGEILFRLDHPHDLVY